MVLLILGALVLPYGQGGEDFMLGSWKYMQYVVVTTKVGEVTLAILKVMHMHASVRKWPPVITVMVIVFPE